MNLIKVARASIYTILALLACNIAFADQIRHLNLSEYIQLALERNESVSAAKQDINAAESRLKEAILNWAPKFNLSVGITYNKKNPYQGTQGDIEIIPGIKIPAQYLSSTGDEYYDSDLTMSITQSLLDSGVISANIAKARMKLELAKVKYLRAKYAAISQVTEKYYELLELAKREYIANIKIENAKNIQKYTNKKYSDEKIGHLEVLENQVKVAELECELTSIVKNRLQKQDEFAQLVSLQSSSEFTANEQVNFNPLSLGNINEIIEDASQFNLDIREARILKEIQKYEIDVAKSDSSLSANLFGNVQYLKTGDTLGNGLKEFDNVCSVGLTVNWPFFDSGKSWNKVDAAVFDFKKAGINCDTITKKAIQGAKEKYYNLEDAKKQVEICQKKENIALERTTIASRLSREGKVSRAEMKEKQIALEEAKVAELKAIINYELIKNDLSEIIGKEDNYNAIVK